MARAARIALDMALGGFSESSSPSRIKVVAFSKNRCTKNCNKTVEASKSLRSASVMSWQYLKTEAVPPMTLSFFHGPGGKKLEDIVSRTTNNFIAGIENKIKQMELEKLKEIQRKEAEAKLLQEKIKAEAKRKSEEAKKEAAKKIAAKDKAQLKAKASSAPETKTKQAAAEPKPKAAAEPKSKQAAAESKPKQAASEAKPKQTAAEAKPTKTATDKKKK